MLVIGRRDFIDFTDWGFLGIESKIDTGAYGSSIHCHHVELFEKEGETRLRFQLLDPDHPEYENKFLEYAEYEKKHVRSSTGELDERYVVKTHIRIFDQTYLTEFSLSDRQKMRYPVLLGRKFLKKRFLVDVTKKNLSKLNQRIKI